MTRDPDWYDNNFWSDWRILFWWFRVRPQIPPVGIARQASKTRAKKWLHKHDHEMCDDLRLWAQWVFRGR